MSALYIVHSSKDRASAIELKARLEAKGYRSAFLDVDPDQGIDLGRLWETELYANMRRCRAAIVICSPHLRESKWCFAEIAHCKALGKEILPIRITGDADHPLLQSIQAIDVAGEGDQAYERLWRRLGSEALWRSGRSPYPGLRAFDEGDAAVFRGRPDEIRDAREILNRLQLVGRAAGLLVIGPSGSGKSSLVRAGLVPELRKDEDHWLLVGPWRPFDDPRATLLSALSAAFQRYTGSAPALDQLSHELRAGLAPLCRELRLRAGRPDATVLVIVDQMEELVTSAARAGGEPPLSEYSFPAGYGASGFLMLGTLRSDFLGPLLSDAAFRDVPFESFVLRALSPTSFAEIIEAPASLAGLELEGGLATTMVADAAGDEALPLLAYSLRELWDRHGAAGRFTIEHYRSGLGGVGGSIRRAAEAAIGEAALDEHEHGLRTAFLSLVSVNDRGDYVRRTARWEELPAAVHPLLERLVGARLLVSRGDRSGRSIEVAHEALFRAWERLARWLQENREFLLWRRRFEPSLHEWERTGRHPGSALRGPSLGEARAWLARNAELLREEEIAFIEEGMRVDRREHEEALALAARSRSAAIAMTAATVNDPLLRLLLVAEHTHAPESLYGIAAALDALVAPLPYAVERHDTAVGRAAMSPDGDLIATGTDDGEVRLWRTDGAESHTLRRGDGSPNGDRVVALAFSARGDRLLIGHDRGRLSVWDVSARKPLAEIALASLDHGTRLSADGVHVLSVERGRVRLFELQGEMRIVRDIEDGRCAAFSPDGSCWAAGLSDGSILTARCGSTGAPTRLAGHAHAVACLAFSADSTVLLSGALDKTARLWRIGGGGEEAVVLEGHGGPVVFVGFVSLIGGMSELAAHRQDLERAGRPRAWAVPFQPFTMDTDDVCRTWRLVGEEPESTDIERGVVSVAVAENDLRLWMAFAFKDGRVSLLESTPSEGNQRARILPADKRVARDIVLDPEHGQVVTAGADGVARLWRLDDSRRAIPAMEHPGAYIWSASFDAQSRQVVTTGSDAAARIWAIDGPDEPKVLTGHARTVICAAFSPDGRQLVTGSKDRTTRLWQLGGGDGAVLSEHSYEVSQVAFSPDGRWILACGGEVVVTPASASTPVLRLSAEILGRPRALFAPDSRTIVVAGNSGRVDIFPLGIDRAVQTFAHEGDEIRHVAFSPDGRVLAVALFDGGVVLRAIPAGETFATLDHVHAVASVAFDGSGGRIATACLDGKVRIWQVHDLARGPRVLRSDLESLASVEFSADGKYLITLSNSDEAHLWSSDRAGEPVRIAAPEDGGTRGASLSPDGAWILARGDRAVHLLPLKWDRLRSALLRRTRVRLTKEQREIYLGETAG